MLEITHHFIDGTHNGKSVGIFPDDGRKSSGLCFVDNTDENIGFPAVIHAFAGDQGSAVIQSGNNGIGNFLRIVGDDFKADGAAVTLLHLPGYGGRGEGVENRENHRLDLIVINKVRGNGNNGVQGEDQSQNTLVRTLFVDQSGNKIRTAGVCAAV